MAAHYFVGTRLIGSAPSAWWCSTSQFFDSLLLICPTCGETWARIVLDSSKEWFFRRTHCPAHGGGSFIPPWSFPLETLPTQVLNREFLLAYSRSHT